MAWQNPSASMGNGGGSGGGGGGGGEANHNGGQTQGTEYTLQGEKGDVAIIDCAIPSDGLLWHDQGC